MENNPQTAVPTAQQTNLFDEELVRISQEFSTKEHDIEESINRHRKAIRMSEKVIDDNQRIIHNLNQTLEVLRKEYGLRKCAIETAKHNYYNDNEPDRYLRRLLDGFLAVHHEIYKEWSDYVVRMAQEGGAQ